MNRRYDIEGYTPFAIKKYDQTPFNHFIPLLLRTKAKTS